MYRVRSTDVWYNAPGVVAAYQPVAAPDAFAGWQNVGNDALLAGRNTAMPGVAPTWASATGWKFNGTTQYLSTGIVPSSTWSVIARFANIASSSSMVLGSRNGIAVKEFALWPNSNSNRLYSNGGRITIAGGNATCVMGLADRLAYLNGVVETSTISVGAYSGDYPIVLGGLNNAGTLAPACNGNILACMFVSRALSASEMRFYSRQMAYCHVNPDWSAWGRRRQYYYAPSATAAAGNVGFGRRGAVALPGGVRIEAVR